MFTRLLTLAMSIGMTCGMTYAQNRLLLLEKGDSLGSIHVHPDYKGYSYTDRFKYTISKPPVTISGAVPFEVKFVTLANEAVNDFQMNHLNGYGMYDLRSLWLSGHERIAYESIGYEDWEEQRKGAEYLKQLVCERPVIREALYNWLMPVYKVAFAAMSIPEQNAYLTLFRNALTYLDGFDLDEEKKAAENDEFVYNRGYLNAFLYRRISKNEISKEDCRYWMQRIITDFESVLRKNPTPADNYVIDTRLNYGYYTGMYYTDYEEPSQPPVVMRKEGEQFRILNDVPFLSIHRAFANMIFGAARVNADSTAYAIMYFDSLHYTFTTTPYTESITTFIMLGDEKNLRMMTVTGWTEIPDQKYGSQVMAVCAIIDMDSGTVITPQMYVPTQIVADPETGEEIFTFSGNLRSNIIYYNPESSAWGVRDGYGNEILPAKYKSVEETETPGVYKVNGKKKVKAKKKS